MAEQNEPCNCGAPVRVHYGPDIRFDPPCTKPMMYRAECSGDCINPSFTSFTRERALELWNERMRKNREDDRAIVAALDVMASPMGSVPCPDEARRTRGVPLPSQAALDSPSVQMPQGFTPEERRAFILGVAAAGKAGVRACDGGQG